MKIFNKIAVIALTVGVLALTACQANLQEEQADKVEQVEEIKDTIEAEVTEKVTEVAEVKETIEAEIVEDLTEDDVVDQLLPIPGTDNFRDLGGYVTTDGRKLKRGVLYRSDSLADLENPEILNELGLVTIIDFRAEKEIEEGPDKLPENHSIKWVNFPIGDPENLGELLPPEALQGQTIAELRSELTELYLAGEFEAIDKRLSGLNIDIAEQRIKRYIEFASLHTDVFRGLMTEILNAEGQPLLFHCEGGKDRTGAGAAFILLTLGVPREDVIDGYLLTNEYIGAEELRAKAPQSLASTIGAHREQLVAALDYINNNYGSFDEFRRTELGISDEEREVLRDLLLE